MKLNKVILCRGVICDVVDRIVVETEEKKERQEKRNIGDTTTPTKKYAIGDGSCKRKVIVKAKRRSKKTIDEEKIRRSREEQFERMARIQKSEKDWKS